MTLHNFKHYSFTAHEDTKSFSNVEKLSGILLNYKGAEELLLGNHNYCRNPGGIEVGV